FAFGFENILPAEAYLSVGTKIKYAFSGVIKRCDFVAERVYLRPQIHRKGEIYVVAVYISFGVPQVHPADTSLAVGGEVQNFFSVFMYHKRVSRRCAREVDVIAQTQWRGPGIAD